MSQFTILRLPLYIIGTLLAVACVNQAATYPMQIVAAQKLYQEANVGEKDGRDAISMFTNYISVADQRNLSRISGDIVCTIDGIVSRANARLVEDGGQIVTSAHVFIDRTDKIGQKLPSCNFSTKSNPSKSIPVILRQGSYFLGSRDPLNDHMNDIAFARLGETIRDVEMPRFGKHAENGEEVLLITTKAHYSKKTIDPDQLVAQVCDVNRSRRSKPDASSYFFTECSAVPGDSGGIYYALRNGHLEAAGIHQSSGDISMNGAPYDINNPDPKKNSFSMGLGFDASILEKSHELAERATGRAQAK